MAAAGGAILITAAKLVARQADRRLHRIIKEEGEEVSRAEGACCRRVVTVEGCTAEGSTAVAGMVINITTIKLAACPADRRLLNREACCRRVVAVEGCTAEGSTTVAGMVIHITTIKVAARRITEGGSMVAGIKVEG